MTSMRTFLTTVALAASITAAQSQPTAPATTAVDHAAHHPADSTAATSATPPAATPGGVPMGTGGGAMMGPGSGAMMGARGGPMMGQMMGGGAGPMMPMMPGAMMPGGGGIGMMAFGHVEGWIAFYKAELGITDAQLPQWNAYADAMRSGAKGMRTAMAAAIKAGKAGGSATLPARADAMVQMMSARLETMKATLAATKSLYAVLSDDQKKTADELLAERPMGMRAWGTGEL